MGEGSSEISVGVLRVLLDHTIEIFNSLFMLVDHLISLGALVNIPNIAFDQLYAFTERENGLFKLLLIAIRQSNMIIQISFIG